MIPLVAGNPRTQPASYTRFVLPFAYTPEPCAAPVSGPRFQITNGRLDHDEWRWRHDYFTAETADVLYRHARWARLEDVQPVHFKVKNQTREIDVEVGRVGLVAFEWPEVGSHGATADFAGLMRTGFLTIDLWFPEQDGVTLADLQKLNDAFRYWTPPRDGHFNQGYAMLLAECPLDLLGGPATIGSKLSASEVPRAYFDRWASLLTLPVTDGNLAWRIVSDGAASRARAWVWGNRESGSGDAHEGTSLGWVAYQDPRAFVWTCAVVDRGARVLGSRPDEATGHPAWIGLLNVDPPSDRATAFERQWARERTYRRWVEGGSLYGFNLHAGAMLAGPDPEPPLWKIFGIEYFDQTLLLLYLRVTTFRFSRALSKISAQARGQASDAEFVKAFEALRWRFALFTNLYEFPLLSSQQQGIEMYEIARRHLDVRALFREVREEIHSAHEFVEMATERRETEKTAQLARDTADLTRTATQLSVVAVLGLVGALASGILGMNVLYTDEPHFGWPFFKGWIGFLAFPVMALVCLLGIWLAARNAGCIARLLGLHLHARNAEQDKERPR